ncbi:MAG: iolB [Paenibacillaceae bacterium]|nr:iolB [Paenibacillaceae bacterium]
MVSYKKHWDGKRGCTPLVASGSSSLEMLEVDMLSLSAGEVHEGYEGDKETALVLLGGTASVTGKEFAYNGIGARKHVFDGAAAAVYIPRNREFRITAESDVRLALIKAPAERDTEPVLIRPEDVLVKELGKPGWQRQAHFILDERVDANRLYIGESFVPSGSWASYPPHKHDEDNMPAEGILEEIYYYEFDRPEGFGIQRLYSRQGDLDETFTVKTGDLVELPRGYHPFCCAPGYQNYYLWIMAGKNRGFYFTVDPDHQWLNK